MADVIVNHMSNESPQFLDYSQRGAASPYNGLFLSFDVVFPQGAKGRDLLAIYRPRPGLPFTCATLANGTKQLLWTTFTPQQVDIDVLHPQGQAYLRGILQTLSGSGIRMVRLDAVGYAIKKAGSSCFMMPETFAFIDAFAAQARALGIEVLVEIHSHYERQIEIARRVDWVYDFALPPLVLHALFNGTAQPLKRWAALRPHNALTVLDTHDGIGIIDIGADAQDRAGKPGLVPPAELDALVERIHANSGGQSRQATGAAASNLDLYQVNCTFYDALGRDDNAYVLARAIQFFMPGVPQVYYVGLLAGENDMALLQSSGVGRDINRHHYSSAEIQDALQRPVVQRLLALIRLRNAHPAFGGTFEVRSSEDDSLHLRWQQGGQWLELRAHLPSHQWQLHGEGGAVQV
jgi:sucrose phosphorylase